jgi:hypothetical protein
MIPQYPSMIASAIPTNGHTPQHESTITTPLTPQNGRFQSNHSKSNIFCLRLLR